MLISLPKRRVALCIMTYSIYTAAVNSLSTKIMEIRIEVKRKGYIAKWKNK
jgi:hypothetical protein